MPPLIIVKGKSPNSLLGFNTEDGPKGIPWTYQENAWTEDLFGVEWFQFFYKHLHPKPTKNKPHLLIIDSHGTCETSGLIKKARAEKVEIFPLPGHTTHYLKPLNRTIFKPFKTAYDRICSEHLQDINNMVSKVTWPGLFWHAFEEAMISPSVLLGFAATGLYPLNPLAIQVSTFLPYKAFKEGSMQSGTDRHPLAWVMNKVAVVTITLEALDNTVPPILRSSVEKMPSASETTPREQENSPVGNDRDNGQESGAALMFESQEQEITSSLVSPILPFESGIRLEDLLEPEVKQFIHADINDLMA